MIEFADQTIVLYPGMSTTPVVITIRDLLIEHL